MNGRTTHPSELTIKPTENGGYIVRHSYDNSNAGPSYMPPKEHAFSTHAEAMAHVNKHLKKGKTHVETQTKPSSISTVPAKGAAPTRRTYGAGAD